MTPVAASEGPSPSAARRAAGSSFYAAMRILPRQRRNAIFEIYGFCRAVDDIADSDAPRDVRLKQLAQWRADIDALFAEAPPPRLAGLAAAVHTFRLSRPDFAAIVDGMEMDVVSDIRAPDFDTLDLYCDRVASAVGRLCVRVFGLETADGIALAHHLGRALQLTNILRDLDEDAAVGRLYLPREALAAGRIVDTDPAGVLASPTLGRACAVVVERARRHFDMADAVMRRSPRRSVRAPRIMAQAYKYMLARLIARGWSAPRQRVRLGRAYLIWVLLRHAVL
jgi:presqualene diphosphate synthase